MGADLQLADPDESCDQFVARGLGVHPYLLSVIAAAVKKNADLCSPVVEAFRPARAFRAPRAGRHPGRDAHGAAGAGSRRPALSMMIWLTLATAIPCFQAVRERERRDSNPRPPA